MVNRWTNLLASLDYIGMTKITIEAHISVENVPQRSQLIFLVILLGCYVPPKNKLRLCTIFANISITKMQFTEY